MPEVEGLKAFISLLSLSLSCSLSLSLALSSPSISLALSPSLSLSLSLSPSLSRYLSLSLSLSLVRSFPLTLTLSLLRLCHFRLPWFISSWRWPLSFSMHRLRTVLHSFRVWTAVLAKENSYAEHFLQAHNKNSIGTITKVLLTSTFSGQVFCIFWFGTGYCAWGVLRQQA